MAHSRGANACSIRGCASDLDGCWGYRFDIVFSSGAVAHAAALDAAEYNGWLKLVRGLHQGDAENMPRCQHWAGWVLFKHDCLWNLRLCVVDCSHISFYTAHERSRLDIRGAHIELSSGPQFLLYSKDYTAAVAFRAESADKATFWTKALEVRSQSYSGYTGMFEDYSTSWWSTLFSASSHG